VNVSFVCSFKADVMAFIVTRCRRVSVRLFVRLSVTSRCSTETAKCRITQITPHDSPGTLMPKYRQNSNGVTPNRGTKCRWGRLNAGAVAENWRLLTRSVVNLARSQVCHTQPTDLHVRRAAARRAGLSATADPYSVG